MQLHLENPIFPKAGMRILMTFMAGKNDGLCLRADPHLPQISAILLLIRKKNNLQIGMFHFEKNNDYSDQNNCNFDPYIE